MLPLWPGLVKISDKNLVQMPNQRNPDRLISADAYDGEQQRNNEESSTWSMPLGPGDIGK